MTEGIDLYSKECRENIHETLHKNYDNFDCVFLTNVQYAAISCIVN